MTTTINAAHPFLKWVGGKKSLLPVLEERLPSFDRYVEPFIGGGALFFKARPERAVISDINLRLINTYTQVRDNVDNVIELLKEHRIAHSKEYYYAHREDFSSSSDVAETAAWFIYYNKTGFNGVFRVNSKNKFNVPMGDYKNPMILDEDNLRRVSETLADTQILCGGFDLYKGKPGDFFYLDPPYHKTYDGYAKDGFTEDNQSELAAFSRRLDQNGAKFMLSNSDTDLIRSLYAGFHIEIVKASRSVSRSQEGRGKTNEVLIRNYG